MATKPPVEWVKVLSFGLGALAIAVPKLMDLSPDLTIGLTILGVVLVVTATVAIVGDWIRGRRSGSAVKLRILGANIMSNGGTDASQIALHVTATNDGIPTTLRDWTLDVTLQSEQTTIHADPLSLSLAPDLVYTNQVIRRSDAIDEKTRNATIISGGQAEGWVLFALRGADRVQIAQDDTSFILSATDIAGKRTTTTESVRVLAAIAKSEGTRSSPP